MKKQLLVCTGILLAVAATGGKLEAHGLKPSLLELREQPNGRFEVFWKEPESPQAGALIKPALPVSCTTVEPPRVSEAEGKRTTRWLADCGPEGLTGRTIAVSGLDVSKTDVLLRLRLADGRQVNEVLSSRRPKFEVPERERPGRVLASYLGLGVHHILLGADHLIFVLGLLLLASSRRRLVATITAFTVGHSVTLSLVVLGLLHLPSAPVEVAIALSILVLAVELARPGVPSGASSDSRGTASERRPSLMRRHPWGLALGFGLLHGLGFAGALAEVGLPPSEVPLALFSFNAGIEAGQLIFVVAVLAALRAFRPLQGRLPTWAPGIPVYVMGTLAAFWVFERMTEVL